MKRNVIDLLDIDPCFLDWPPHQLEGLADFGRLIALTFCAYADGRAAFLRAQEAALDRNGWY